MKPYRHNPESSLARRNRALRREQKRELDGKIDLKKSNFNCELDNIVDEGFCKHLANAGTNASKFVNIPAPWLDTIINGRRLCHV